MEPKILHSLEKHKYVEWGLGIVVVIIAFLALRARSAGKSTGGAIVAGTPQQSATDLTGVLNAISKSQAGIAALSENQLTSAKQENLILGAESWLSCCDPLNWNCDASCFKQKGGSTVGVPGSGSVTDVKTQHKDVIQQYASPFSGCLRGASYDLACVGSLMGGSPTYNQVTADVTATRAVRLAPQIQPIGMHV